jgi:hypothetical protein
MKTALKGTVAAAALLAFTAPVNVANAGKVESANSKVDLTIGGRIHRAIINLDDGQHEDIFQSDGITSDSEIWMTGSGAITESVTMGGLVRWDIPKNQAGFGFGTDGNSTQSAAAGNNKYEYIYFTHKSLGTLSIGDIEPGADGTMDARYSKTHWNAEEAAAGSANFFAKNGASVGAVTNFISKIDPGDGNNKIRFDSNSYAGVSLHGDYRVDGGGSVGVKYSGSFGDTSFFVNGGFDNNGSGTQIVGGSVGVKLAMGLHVAGNYGRTHSKDDTTTANTDPEWWRVIGGYAGSFNSLGTTNLTVSYAEGQDAGAVGNKGEAIRVSVHQAFDSVGGAIELAYTNLSASNTAGTSIDDIDSIVLETSFNF